MNFIKIIYAICRGFFYKESPEKNLLLWTGGYKKDLKEGIKVFENSFIYGQLWQSSFFSSYRLALLFWLFSNHLC